MVRCCSGSCGCGQGDEAESALYTKSARGGIGDSPVELSHLTERAEQSTRSSARFTERSMTVRKRYRLPSLFEPREFSSGLGVHSVIVEEAPLASVTGGEEWAPLPRPFCGKLCCQPTVVDGWRAGRGLPERRVGR